MAKPSRHENLNHKDGSPKKTPLYVQSTVHFDMDKPVPKKKIAAWFDALPEKASVSFSGVVSGKAHFSAEWTETR